MRAALLAATVISLALGGNVQAASKLAIAEPVQVSPWPSGSKVKSVKLAKAVITLSEGQQWATWGSWLACSTLIKEKLNWNSGLNDLDTARFSSVFDDESRKAGLTGESEDLFTAGTDGAELQIGVRITDMDAQFCSSDTGGMWRGSMQMIAEWQVFDPMRREVVARIQTTGGGADKGSIEGGTARVLLAAFRENVRVLLNQERFRQAIDGSAPGQKETVDSKAPIVLAGAIKTGQRPISETSASVVALFTGNAMGSGFLVSDDGYILTNQHVVGNATTVRVRWSDGLETTGEVVRSDKRRDVALVKVEPRGRPPLALVRGNPTVGSAVYAVGTPLDATMLNTVTRGIVSANRFIDGFAFIQSDVGVNQGNSGGPLLDEKGRVIGITVIKLFADEGQRNLNLFIPIGDALDFLALKTGG